MTETSEAKPSSGADPTKHKKPSDHIASSTSSETSTKGREFLRSMLNKLMKIKLSDGRILIGVFLCTDKESNVILGSCAEYVVQQSNTHDKGKMLS